jgi:hypothetical protein
MPKGEKIRPKQEMDQLPLENIENSRVDFCVVKILLLSLSAKSLSLVGRMLEYSYCLLVLKVCLLWGECLIMGKRGSF